MFLTTERWKHFAAMILIGDGVMAILHPQRDAKSWKVGPKSWQHLMEELHSRPALTRAIGVAQIAGGILWALQQQKEEDAA